jgi:hypothetical protein
VSPLYAIQRPADGGERDKSNRFLNDFVVAVVGRFLFFKAPPRVDDSSVVLLAE